MEILVTLKKINTEAFDKEPFLQYEMLEKGPKATLPFMVTSLITQWNLTRRDFILHLSY